MRQVNPSSYYPVPPPSRNLPIQPIPHCQPPPPPVPSAPSPSTSISHDRPISQEVPDDEIRSDLTSLIPPQRHKAAQSTSTFTIQPHCQQLWWACICILIFSCSGSSAHSKNSIHPMTKGYRSQFTPCPLFCRTKSHFLPHRIQLHTRFRPNISYSPPHHISRRSTRLHPPSPLSLSCPKESHFHLNLSSPPNPPHCIFCACPSMGR